MDCNGEQQRHQRVPFFLTLCLGDGPLRANIILPGVNGGRTIGQSQERQNCACLRHVEESLKHGRPQHVVESADAVHTQNRRSGVDISCSPQELTHAISARSSGQGILKCGTLTLENSRNQPSQRASCGNAPDPRVWFGQSWESRSMRVSETSEGTLACARQESASSRSSTVSISSSNIFKCS